MSGNSIPDIPRPRSGDPETQRFYDAVRQAFAAVQRTDSQALVTYEELGRRLLPLYDQYKNISDKVGGGKACDGASVPGAVSNIQTSGAFGVITLTWDAPVYRGHGSTEVWASKGTDVSAAELVGTSETTYLEHAVPAIEFTTENEYEVSRNYWLRHVSACDKGYGPWSDMVTASTPASPTLIGELMAKNADVMIQSLGLDQDLSALADGISEVRTVAQNAVTKADAVKLTADQAYAAVQTKAEASTVTNLATGLQEVQSKYTVKLDTNGFNQGFGILNTGNPLTSGAAFNVNNFYVTNTVNGTKNKPFMIEGNKVYADNLFVRQANIEKLNVMDVAVNDEIKSSNFVAGSSGWRITRAGDAELNGLIVRTGNLANDSVTKMAKEQRFWSQVVNTWPTVVNSVTISAGSAPMDVTLIWGGRCGYLKAVDCQVQAYKNGSPWIDFGVVGYPAMDMPGWVASDTIAAGTSATYSAILNAAPGVQAEKVTLIAIGRMK